MAEENRHTRVNPRPTAIFSATVLTWTGFALNPSIRSKSLAKFKVL
jgi:hypothetical protein